MRPATATTIATSSSTGETSAPWPHAKVKGSGTGAKETDTTLPPNTILYTVRLSVASTEADGVVFDGTAADFHLPSGGMRDRSGTTVVEATDVAIGKLEVHP